ncbi:right-handed parallel beta-helix repeat-containing protein [Sphingopyxis terrae]|uniref:hypothetical protein n=1 Tax=Sphingopyxis terrae TaxID=33052 RepID=UPI0007899BE1|nr:hypothetical protein [Sphingopyxis terrae]
MAQILPRDLPAAGSVNTSSAIIIDDGSGVKKATPAQLVSSGFPVASQAEAEAGVVSDKAMTPQRVSQAIDALGVSQAVLASSSGGEMVGVKRSEPSTVSATAKTLFEQTVSARDWGVSGLSTSSDIAKLQAAVDEAPLGSTLLLPGGVIFSDGLSITRHINIRGENGATILGVGTNPAINLVDVRIAPGETLEGSSNSMLFTNFRAEVALGYTAKSTLNVESQSGVDAAQLNYSFIGGRIAGRDDQAEAALRIAGMTSQMHTFQGMDIVNGVLLDGCADACRLIGNNIGGLRTGIKVNVVAGAFNTLIRDNVITSTNGAIHIIGGSRVIILNNQIEQIGTNGHPDEAHIILEALTYSLRDIEIAGNNFGGGALEHSIVMKTSGGRTIEGVKVGTNTWGKTTDEDMMIADSGVKHTYLAAVQNFRGDRGGGGFTVYPAYSSNTLDVNDLLTVNDGGVGTRRVRNNAQALGGSSSTALQNSWTCAASMYAQIIDDEVRFSGYADGPSSAQNAVQIATLPAGMRPQVEEIFELPGYDVGTGARVAALCQVQTDGDIIMTRASSTNSVRIGLAPLRFVAARTGYDPGY